MKDRSGHDYLPVWQRQPGESTEARVDRAIGHVRQIALMSPARQADKALGLSGRQRRKRRKWLRHPCAVCRHAKHDKHSCACGCTFSFARLERAEADAAAGRTRPFAEVMAELRANIKRREEGKL